MRYHTFDLTVSATGAPHEYLLSAQSSTQGEAGGRTKIDPSSALLADLFAQFGDGTISSTNLQALGATFYQSLFAGEIGMLFNRALGETLGNEALGLRLRLRLNPPELAALPWEFLYSPERRLFLAASVETPLSRYLNLPEPMHQLACPEKINLLVVITQNSGLDTTAERRALEKVASQLRDRLTVDFLEGEATSAAIRAALRQKDYHILHYAGHGDFKNDEAFIYLDHEEKLTEPIAAEQFAHFFTDYPFTRLVFLNACQGATRSSHQALAGVAPQLVLRGVPAVVAMQEKIDNDDAILFATEFYAELCHERDGGQVEVAISRARKALLQEEPNSAVFG
ncbi:MAG: CHAT domain-containing protein, partial [bacterium]